MTYKFLQLSLTEIMICQMLIQKVDNDKNSEKIELKLKKFKIIYEQLKEKYKLNKNDNKIS